MTKQRMRTTRWGWDEGERIPFSEQSAIEGTAETSDRIRHSRCRVLQPYGDRVLLEIWEDEVPGISKRTREGDERTELGVIEMIGRMRDSWVVRMRDLGAFHERTGSNDSGFPRVCEAYTGHDQDERRVPLIHQR